MRLVRWFIGITATILVLTGVVAGVTAVIIGTETGTRWLLRVAEEQTAGALRAEEPSGALLSGVAVRQLEWRSEGLKLSFEELDINVDLLPLLRRRLEVRSLGSRRFELTLVPQDQPDASAEAELNVNLPIEIDLQDVTLSEFVLRRGEDSYVLRSVELAASLTGPRLAIPRLKAEGFGVAAEIEGRLRLAGAMPLTASGRWRQTASEGLRLSGAIELEGDLDRLRLAHGLATPFVVETQGEITLAGGAPVFDLVNRWDAFETAVGNTDIRTGGGTLLLAGTISEIEVDLDTEAGSGPLPMTAIELDAVTSLERMRIGRLDLRNEFGTARVTGATTFRPELTADIAFAVSEFDAARLGQGIEGEIGVSGTALVNVGAAGPEVAVVAESLSGTLNGLTLAGTVTGAYTPSVITIESSRLELGANRLIASGTWGEQIRLDANAVLPSIGDLLPAAGGSAEIALAVSGPRAAPAGKLRFAGSELALGGARLDTLTVAIDGEAAQHSIEASLSGYGTELDLDVEGGLDGGQWQGSVNSLGITPPVLERWTSTGGFPLTAGPGAVVLSGLCLAREGQKGTLCADGEYRADGGSRFEVTVDDAPVASLPLGLPAGVMPAGVARVDLGGTWEDGVLGGELEAEVTGGALSTVYEGEETRIEFDDIIARATISENRLDSTLTVPLTGDRGGLDAAFSSDDILDTSAPIDGNMSVRLDDADLFAILLTSVENPRGRIDGQLDVGGSLEALAFSGELTLSEGAFTVRPAGIDVSDVTLRASQQELGRLSLSGSARSGDGEVRVEGFTEMSADTGIRSEISIDGEAFQLLRLPDWQIDASPDIDIVFDERSAMVTGRLLIPSAQIRMRDLPSSAARQSPDAVVHEAGVTERREGRRIDIDVVAELGDEVSYEGFGLTTSLAGAVDIRGGSQQPYVGYGEVELVGGRYEAYGQDLTIESGRLIFSGPLNRPQLDIRATRSVNGIVAGVIINGPPSRLRSELFSEPPMSDAEALSYLLRGRPLSQETSSEDGDLLNQAAFALGMSGAGSIAADIGNALGLDTLELEGGADDSRVVAGTRIGDRLRVEYGYGLIDNLGTLLLKYQINKRLSLESRTGTVSALDIVYSVRKK